ncbi:hypothetical protein ANN_01332 [Periplaneta americana]|uniref:MULE transposase domain-containing protein n=1 Tax=Periplaneta americana TaxID=6978 RepID=A0ABQ8TXB5_PERAM|nr:hypothetical protein ANN_01332 [Periplaneta americana]
MDVDGVRMSDSCRELQYYYNFIYANCTNQNLVYRRYISDSTTRFTQIVTIYGEYAGKALIVVYSLLPNKRQESYEVILRSVLQQFLDYGFDNSEPSVVICDFEMSIRRAVQHVFRHATLRFCFFHLNQSAWRKIQELGLQAAYTDENDTSSRLSFEDVPVCFHTVLEIMPRRMTDFVKYLNVTYVGITERGRGPAVEA